MSALIVLAVWLPCSIGAYYMFRESHRLSYDFDTLDRAFCVGMALFSGPIGLFVVGPVVWALEASMNREHRVLLPRKDRR